RVSARTAVDLDCGYAAIHRTAKSQSRGEKPHFQIIKFLYSILRVSASSVVYPDCCAASIPPTAKARRRRGLLHFQIFKFPNSPLSIFPTHQRPGTKLTPERRLRGRKHMHGIQR